MPIPDAVAVVWNPPGGWLDDKKVLREILANIPQQPQRQDGDVDQLNDLRDFANRLGMYDAADLIRNIIEKKVQW